MGTETAPLANADIIRNEKCHRLSWGIHTSTRLQPPLTLFYKRMSCGQVKISLSSATVYKFSLRHKTPVSHFLFPSLTNTLFGWLICAWGDAAARRHLTLRLALCYVRKGRSCTVFYLQNAKSVGSSMALLATRDETH